MRTRSLGLTLFSGLAFALAALGGLWRRTLEPVE